MKGPRAKALFSILLAGVLACGMTACKPTDFFTEVIISPFAETVDTDNDTHTIINSPDASEESDELSALDWSDDSTRSEAVENLVVYSSDPTTSMQTRHTVFDLYPLLSNVEASDGVRVLYDAEAVLDEENEGSDEEEDEDEEEEDEEEEDEPESVSAGGEVSEEALESLEAELAEEGLTTGEASEETEAVGGSDEASEDVESESTATGEDPEETGEGTGTQAGGDDGGDTTGEGENVDEPESEGTAEDPYAGYDGEVTVYQANNAFAEVPEVETLAVLGTDVAVLVQALGGDGAICAMSEEAFYGADDDTTASNFVTVFGDLAGDFDAEEFAATRLLWENDGSDPEDLTDVDALVEACGEGGIIVYDQDLGDQYSFFTDDQRKELYAADITLVPVDLSTVQGILDAVAVVGDALASSTTCENDASAAASAYTKAVRSIVKGVAATHGGTLAATTKDGNYTLLTDYVACPVGSASVVGGLAFPIRAYIATDAASGWLYTGSYDLDVSDVVLFQTNDYDSSPLAFWGQVAGVAPGSSVNNSVKTLSAELLWPFTNVSPTSSLSGSGSAYNRWLSSDKAYSTMQAGPSSQSEGLAIPETYGLGSKYIPYLIVCATEDYTADELQELVIDSLGEYGVSGEATTYSAFPFYSASVGEGTGTVPMSSGGLRSTIGALNAETGYYESPFYSNLSTSSVVRANPTGLLGSWSEGTMESVLEAVWLADLYSRSPEGCSYTAINDMSDFSVTIGDYTCTTTEECVVAFYRTFYRLSESAAQECYDLAVTDQLEDL